VFSPLRFASPATIRDAFGAEPGSIGPIGFQGKVYMDRSVAVMSDAVIGANDNDYHADKRETQSVQTERGRRG
jgi:prolyl-tRNA synthetase